MMTTNSVSAEIFYICQQ